MLKGMLSTAEDGIVGFDCNQVLTVDQINAFVVDKFKFAIRYIPRIARASIDLTPAEGQRILDNGLGLGVVQHVAGENWTANRYKGTIYGATAAREVTDIGFPKGMTVWCDLEGVDPSTFDTGVIDYCREWYGQVDKAGYNPGLYCGWHTMLTGAQLYSLPFKSYWRAYNLNANEYPLPRGFQMIQRPEENLVGVKYDPDITQADNNGDRAWFLWPV